MGEKWVRSYSNISTWYLILPSGELYEWTGSFGSSIQIATLDSSYHTDPSLLFDVSEPADFTDVTATIVGNTLTLNRMPAFVGTLTVRVTASDTVLTDTEMFILSAE